MSVGVNDNTGRYSRVFLDEVFGSDRYEIKSYKLGALANNTGLCEEISDTLLHDNTLSIAYVSDTKITMVWLKDFPGWLTFCGPMGIEISPSAKIAKRLTMFTRLAYLYKRFELDEVNITSVAPCGYSDYPLGALEDPEYAVRFLDGANVISVELLEQLITNASGSHRGDPWIKEMVNTAVDNAGSFSIRVSTPEGQIKGDCLVAPRNKMGGNDLLYCTENLKTEFKTKDFVFFLLEPHPGHRTHAFSPDEAAPHPVWSDVQSMSWLGEWLYPYKQLKSCLKDFISTVADELANNIYPAFFTSHEKIDDPYSTISTFQRQALEWEKRGPGRFEKRSHPRAGTSLGQSIFLQERIAHGAINMLTSKTRWPVPCAIYVHVATDSWLHMAGYSGGDTHPWPFKHCQTPRGKVWLHEETGRLVYNDLDFAELYERHGGWDLDDSVKAHYRTYKGDKVIVTVRSPNSWGEYDIKNYVPGTYFPTWQRGDGTTMSFPELDGERPEILEEMDVNYRYNSLSPSVIRKEGELDDRRAMRGERYTREQVEHALQTAIKFRTVFGRYSNAEMTYFYTIGDYRREQLAPIEAVVDACTQEQSEKARELIVAEIKKVTQEIKDSGKPADFTLWKERMKRFDEQMHYTHGTYSKFATTHQDLCALYKTKLFAIAQSAADQVDEQIIELGQLARSKGQTLVNWYYQLARDTSMDNTVAYDEDDEDDEERATAVAERYRKINDIMVTQLVQLAEPTVYNLVLGMAAYVYSTPRGTDYKDTPLFQVGSPGTISVFEYYLRALEHFGIGNENWSETHVCPECGVNRMYTDAMEYQKVLYEERCADCW